MKTPASIFKITPSPLCWNASVKLVRLQQNIAQLYLTQWHVSLQLLQTQSKHPLVPGNTEQTTSVFDFKCYRDHPDYPGFTEEGDAEKTCRSDGEWWRDPETNLTWSDYNPCVPDWSFHETMSLLRVVGNLTSFTFLLGSLLIFTMFYSSLKCGRVTMHMNLFLAFIMRKAIKFVFYYSRCQDCQNLKTFVLTQIWMACLQQFILATLLSVHILLHPERPGLVRGH